MTKKRTEEEQIEVKGAGKPETTIERKIPANEEEENPKAKSLMKIERLKKIENVEKKIVKETPNNKLKKKKTGKSQDDKKLEESIPRSDGSKGSPLLTGSILQIESDLAPELFDNFILKRKSLKLMTSGL